jgi:ubiquinone/menaquinone biosynthesis C-methylase UbiE
MSFPLYKQSRQWDHALKLLSCIETEPEEEILAFLNNPSLGKHGLDIGCGLGRHTLAALKLGFKMTAIDFSEYAVIETRKLIKSQEFQANIFVASMHNLPFKDGEFDFTFSWCVLNHGTRSLFERALMESIRVLRSGGVSFGFVMSRKDPRYRQGIQVERDCFIFTEGAEVGICHFFPSRMVLVSTLKRIAYIKEFREVQYKDLRVYHPESIFSCHFAYLIQKPCSSIVQKNTGATSYNTGYTAHSVRPNFCFAKTSYSPSPLCEILAGRKKVFKYLIVSFIISVKE